MNKLQEQSILFQLHGLIAGEIISLTAAKQFLDDHYPEIRQDWGTKRHRCHECGKVSVYTLKFEGKHYCRDCSEELFIDCIECGTIHRKEDTIACFTSLGDIAYVCQDCKDEVITFCRDCGKAIYQGDNELCLSCKENYVKNKLTGELIHKDNAIQLWDGQHQYWYPMDTEHFHCSHCGKEHFGTADYHYNDHDICDNCFNRFYSYCYDCGELFNNEDLARSNYGNQYCSDCAEEYHRCSSCGVIIEGGDEVEYDENNDCYCTSCYSSRYANSIRSYGYKPSPIFLHKTPPQHSKFFGVELEVDNGNNAGKTAHKVCKMLDDRVYCKHDGSLSNRGFEIVSHPATLDFHEEEMGWEKTFDLLVDQEFRSHDTTTCGLHVHVSREAFGEGQVRREMIGRTILFVENNWSDIIKFSRRDEDRVNQWAGRYRNIRQEDSPEDAFSKANNDGDRYRAVNLRCTPTIEFRFFRGTLKANTFFASIEFCDILLDFVKSIEESEVIDANFKGMVKFALEGKRDYFCKYVEERGIWIPEHAAGQVLFLNC